ncbi:MAG: dihydrolipoamide acetyltransferase family protein [Bacteroidota bacterium]
MTLVTMVMPAMGESVMEATVIQWLKQEGDMVAAEESILEVATDKVDSEVPTPYAGKLQKLLVQKGEVVKIGAPLAIIAAEGEALENDPIPPEPAAAPPQPTLPSPIHPMPALQASTQRPSDGRFYSPLVRHIAQQEQMDPQLLGQIPGTGKNNRVTKHDLLAYLQHRPKPDKSLEHDASSLAIAPEDEVIQLDRVRQMIAERMVASKRTVPHVTSFVEADVTDIVRWRDVHKEDFKHKAGTPPTYTTLLLLAVIRALKDFPLLNAWVTKDQIIKKKAINIGLAVALPDNNVIVPVIKNADKLGLIALAQNIKTLVYKAHHQQLVPDELAGATYTVSNLGSFQNLMGTPIIVQPQVAIMALGAIVKKPAVLACAQGEDTIAIRHRMYLSHSYDHRVIDGALGGGFAKRVADYLQSFVDWVYW